MISGEGWARVTHFWTNLNLSCRIFSPVYSLKGRIKGSLFSRIMHLITQGKSISGAERSEAKSGYFEGWSMTFLFSKHWKFSRCRSPIMHWHSLIVIFENKKCTAVWCTELGLQAIITNNGRKLPNYTSLATWLTFYILAFARLLYVAQRQGKLLTSFEQG